MITLAKQEFDKLFLKGERYEIYSKEHFNSWVEDNMEVLQKGEEGELSEDLEKSEYETLKEELRSFTPIEVISESNESKFRIEKSIQYVREKQVDWDEPELIKGEDGEMIEKAKSGTYTNTALNRKLGRVGQKYGSKKESIQEDGREQKGNLLTDESNKNKTMRFKNFKDLENHLDNDKSVQNYSGLTDYENYSTINIKTKYGMIQRKVKLDEEE